MPPVLNSEDFDQSLNSGNADKSFLTDADTNNDNNTDNSRDLEKRNSAIWRALQDAARRAPTMERTMTTTTLLWGSIGR